MTSDRRTNITPPKIQNRDGKAIVKVKNSFLKRIMITLGLINSPEASKAYAEVLQTLNVNDGRWLDSVPHKKTQLTVTEVCHAFVEERLPEYRPDSGEPRKFRDEIIPALVLLHGSKPISEFTPKAFVKVREHFIAGCTHQKLCKHTYF